MIKIPVTYTNFDGEEETKDLYFHMSMRELTQMELSTEGGMHDKLAQLLQTGKGLDILTFFEEMVGRAYGEREDNNPNSFLKSPQITSRFMNSPAYDALFADLIQNSATMITFINGLIPADLAKSAEVQAAMASVRNGETVELQLPADDEGPKLLTDEELAGVTGLAHPKDVRGKVLPWAYREPTQAEIQRMSRQQLAECMQRKGSGWMPRD